MKQKVILIFLILLINLSFTKEVAILSELIQPRNMIVLGEKIYITDYPSLYIYSAGNYRLLKKFGRKGQGPGEFFLPMELPDFKRAGLKMSLKGDSLLINSMGRISVFTREGVFKNSIRFNPHGTGEKLIPFREGFVGSKPHREGSNKIYWTVNYYVDRVKKVR